MYATHLVDRNVLCTWTHCHGYLNFKTKAINVNSYHDLLKIEMLVENHSLLLCTKTFHST